MESIVDLEREERRAVWNTVPPWEAAPAHPHDRTVPHRDEADEPEPPAWGRR